MFGVAWRPTYTSESSFGTKTAKISSRFSRLKGFVDLFKTAVIENESLTNAMRSQYLFTSIKNKLRIVMSNLNVSGNNYEIMRRMMKEKL
jgi:hypothetical protein